MEITFQAITVQKLNENWVRDSLLLFFVPSLKDKRTILDFFFILLSPPRLLQKKGP